MWMKVNLIVIFEVYRVIGTSIVTWRGARMIRNRRMGRGIVICHNERLGRSGMYGTVRTNCRSILQNI